MNKSHREESEMLQVDRGMDLGELVFELRDERGWSQSELARRADLSRNTVSSLEAGLTKPASATIRRLARAFDMTAHEFLATEEGSAKAEVT